MKNPLVSRLFSLAMSFVLAFSLMMSFFGITSSCMLRSESYVRKCVNAYSDKIKTDLTDLLELELHDGDYDKTAVTNAVDDSMISYLSGKITKSIILQSRIDFSTDTTLYNAVFKSVEKYSGIENADIKNKLSSQAVDIINGYFASAEYESGVLSLLHSKAYMAAAFAGIAAVFVSVLLIDLINSGRHKKYSYIGTGLVSAGYSQIIISASALRYSVPRGVEYASLEVFDDIISDIVTRALEIQIYSGCALLVAGLLMLVLNYRYFYKKNKRIAEQREFEAQMRNEYMLHYNSKNAPQVITPGEREVMDIDF